MYTHIHWWLYSQVFSFFFRFILAGPKKEKKWRLNTWCWWMFFLLGILCITFYILYRADTFFFGWDFYWHFGDDWRKFLRMSTWEEILILFSPWNSFWKIKRMSTRVCLLGMFSTTCTHDFSSFFFKFLVVAFDVLLNGKFPRQMWNANFGLRYCTRRLLFTCNKNGWSISH